MEIKIYGVLPREAAEIRRMVFVEEQGFRNEFDGIDRCAKHLVLFDEKTPVATCRFFRNHSGQYVVGRIAVRKQYRGQGIGSRLLEAAETEIAKAGGSAVFLHAQDSARDFYKNRGTSLMGRSIWMKIAPIFGCARKSRTGNKSLLVFAFFIHSAYRKSHFIFPVF